MSYYRSRVTSEVKGRGQMPRRPRNSSFSTFLFVYVFSEIERPEKQPESLTDFQVLLLGVDGIELFSLF